MVRRLAGIGSAIAVAWGVASCSLLVDGDNPKCKYLGVTAGATITCAFADGGRALECWGQGSGEQPVPGSFTDTSVPTVVQATEIEKVVAGTAHACLLDTDERVQCWGLNNKGEVGIGNNAATPEPVAVNVLGAAIDVSAGRERTCAIQTDGKTYCWGSAELGALGIGDISGNLPGDQSDPVLVDMAPARLIAVGENSACVVAEANGTVRCWGDNRQFQVGVSNTGNHLAPIEVEDQPWLSSDEQDRDDPVAIDVSNHVCLATESGSVYCWGAGESGQLADSGRENLRVPQRVPFVANPGIVITSVGVGIEHSCALSSDGEVFCWGGNEAGQLGLEVEDGQTPSPFETDPTRVKTNVASLSVGGFHTCVTLTSGHLECWGSNAFGQIGQGDAVVQRTAARTQASVLGTNVEQIAAGNVHTCVRDASDKVLCWGDNSAGQLGKEPGGPSSGPVEVLSFTATDVAVGSAATCAVSGDPGVVNCWGFGGTGRLGNGLASTDEPTPIVPPPSEMPAATAVTLGNRHGCALLTDPVNTVTCWGDNSGGQLGDGGASGQISEPLVLTAGEFGDAKVTVIAAGGTHTCALAGGSLWCWGDNRRAQLGSSALGNSSASPSLIDFPLATPPTRLVAGLEHTCAIAEGELYCWGRNDLGQSGSDDTTDDIPSPRAVASLVSVRDVALSGLTTCAIDNDGNVFCFGDNSHGELGNGEIESSAEPVQVVRDDDGTPLANVASLTAGLSHFCARQSGGDTYCWGNDANGKLGTLRPMTFPEPTRVKGLSCKP